MAEEAIWTARMFHKWFAGGGQEQKGDGGWSAEQVLVLSRRHHLLTDDGASGTGAAVVCLCWADSNHSITGGAGRAMETGTCCLLLLQTSSQAPGTEALLLPLMWHRAAQSSKGAVWHGTAAPRAHSPQPPHYQLGNLRILLSPAAEQARFTHSFPSPLCFNLCCSKSLWQMNPQQLLCLIPRAVHSCHHSLWWSQHAETEITRNLCVKSSSIRSFLCILEKHRLV